MQNDYMDPDILQSMIDCGFSIGFHGHQHRTQYIEEKYQFGTEKRMVVISAGTLCTALPSSPWRDAGLQRAGAGPGETHCDAPPAQNAEPDIR